MDINALSSGSSPTGSTSPRSAKKTADSLGLSKALNQGALVSGLLPTATSSASSGSGAGLGPDIYLAVGMQTQGMMSLGLTGIQIANISLGIDMSQASKDQDAAAETDGAASESTSTDAATGDAKAPPPVDEAGHAARVLDGMLKEDAASPSRIYVRPELSNPGLGGLLNSLG